MGKMVVFYKDKESQRQIPVYIGNYKECFEFYVKNKSKYLNEDLHLGIENVK